MAKKKSKQKVSLTTVVVVLLLAIFEFFLSPALEAPVDLITNPQSFTTALPSPVSGELRIHYIDVGQADATLITLDDMAMLIDAGEVDCGEIVLNYIKSQGISELDYVIGTHPHSDHIGGMSYIVENIAIKKILMPKAENGPLFENLLDTIERNNLTVTTPHVGDTYKFADASFTILHCKNETIEELNDTSIVIRLVFGEQSYIFCADAEKASEYEMMDSGLTLKSNVIKIGHHGSTTSSLEKFLLTVDPEIAIISVGENSYGHPHEKIINRLNRLKITTYRTDENGTIIISSDGQTNKVTVTKGE